MLGAASSHVLPDLLGSADPLGLLAEAGGPAEIAAPGGEAREGEPPRLKTQHGQ
jgi:hypothetical protein